jgi:dTDP-4-amino-4,6-dideoxygalactose transaminase
VMDGDDLLGLNLRMPELVGAVALGQVRKLDRVVSDMRALKANLVAALGDLGPVRLRRSSDPEGDCGSVVAMLFPDGDSATRVAAALGVRRLIDSGRHYYGNITRVLNEHLGYDAGPGAGALPTTDDLLGRVVLLAVGVNDTYLGAGFGIAPGVGSFEIEATADRVRRVIQASL